MTDWTRERVAALDAADPLAPFREEFQLPDGVVYLNGNSLGPLPKAAAAAVRVACETEWGEGLITAWNGAGWFDLPHRLGRQLAGLLGARADEVIFADATGINLFKAVAAALTLRPQRRLLLLEGSNFPTNTYVVQGLITQLGRGHEIRFAERDEIMAAIDDDLAAVVLTHAHYRTAHLHDMAAITARAHQAGALAVWDLCHSAGVIEVDLNGAGADFAVGCSYKYLNGGPGAPAWLFAARRHHDQVRQPLTGWWSHAAPFAFERDYRPVPGIGRFASGTQPILSLRAAEAGIALACRADRAAVAAKARALGDLFIALVDQYCPDAGFTLVSPRDGALRGGHVAYDHAHGYPIMKALIAAGVIGDFRAPATLRFGFSPLFLRHDDVWRAVAILAEVMAHGRWRDPRYHSADKVT